MLGGNLWTSGYYANTVGDYSNTEAIRKYISEQGKETEYKQLYRSDNQLTMFDGNI